MADEKGQEGAGGAVTAEVEESAVDSAVALARQRQDEVVPFTVASESPLPKSSREVVVEIPRAEWDSRLGVLLKDVQSNAAIQGFRKGKVPAKLLQRRFSREMSNQLVETLAPGIVRKYEQDSGTTLYGVPSVTNVVTEGDGPVRLTLAVEVKPEIEPKDYTGLSIEVPGHKMAEGVVDRRLEDLRQQNATFEEADKGLGAGDAVVVDLQAVDAKGHTISQETEKIYEDPHNELPHAVFHALEGKKAGETVENVKAPAPEGKGEARYTVTVRAVKELKLPELDDEFAKDLGQDSLEALRTMLTEQADKALKSMNEDEAFEVLVDQIVAQHDFEVPPALKAHVERDMARSDYSYLTRTGMTPPRLRGLASRKAYQEELDRAAEQRVKGFLLLDAIGRKEDVQASEEDVNAALEERAQQEGRKAVAIRAAMEKRREFVQFTEQVRFNKVRDFLLSKTNVTYVDRPEPAADAADDSDAEDSPEGSEKA